jgi:hypothetical protein
MIRVWTYRDGNKVEALLVRAHSGGQKTIMYKDGEFDVKDWNQVTAINPVKKAGGRRPSHENP